MEDLIREQSTPSVYFNFDYSSQKTNEISLEKQYVPFQYTCTEKGQQKGQDSSQELQFVTPPSYLRREICKNLYDNEHQHQQYQQQQQYRKDEEDIGGQNVGIKMMKIQGTRGKIDTQQFFQEFDNHFVVNFVDSPAKNQFGGQFRKTFQSCPEGRAKECGNSKIDSRISEPVQRNKRQIEPENQEEVQLESTVLLKNQSNQQKNQDIHQADKQKQNKDPNIVRGSRVLNCEIRKRMLLKNNEKIAAELQKRKSRPKGGNTIINQGNLLIVTASGWQRWSDKPVQKKQITQKISSQPLKRGQKSLKKAQSNIFTTRQIFKDTLRSTTLDSWRKKFTQHKNQLDLKHKSRAINIFQKPFAYLR